MLGLCPREVKSRDQILSEHVDARPALTLSQVRGAKQLGCTPHGQKDIKLGKIKERSRDLIYKL